MTPKILLALAFLGLAALPLEAQDSGLRTIPATEGFAATLVKLEKAIKSGGMKVFTRIDHAAAAKEFGLTMPPSTVVIFGNPKSGTPNFLKKPTLAIDLPLKILVWQDDAGKTFVTYNSPAKFWVPVRTPRSETATPSHRGTGKNARGSRKKCRELVCPLLTQRDIPFNRDSAAEMVLRHFLLTARSQSARL